MTDRSHPTPAERAIGNFSPRLVRLADDVLFWGCVGEKCAF
ncbi:MAG: hypothetical protein JWP08_328 [Bryobacterales bacterium]|nr:hypothetical protein [Bryobacterales bacterium]